jgi:hypothetical protein
MSEVGCWIVDCGLRMSDCGLRIVSPLAPRPLSLTMPDWGFLSLNNNYKSPTFDQSVIFLFVYHE